MSLVALYAKLGDITPRDTAVSIAARIMNSFGIRLQMGRGCQGGRGRPELEASMMHWYGVWKYLREEWAKPREEWWE